MRFEERSMLQDPAFDRIVHTLGCVIFAALGTVTCSGATEPSHLANLPGIWEWVASSDVQTQEVHTPVSEGFTARLEFLSDGERQGMFVYSRDGNAVVQDQYAIAFEDAPGNDFIHLQASIDYLKEFAWITVGGDSLRLNGVFELGFNSVYVRVRN